jgi:hypothetical protein
MNSGLIAAFAGELFPSQALRDAQAADDGDTFYSLLAELIRQQTDVTPLDLVATVASQEDVKPETQKRIFDAYDTFLAQMSAADTRKHLDAVAFSDAADDPVYGDLRSISREFREGINSLFFDEHPILKRLIRSYGVF